MRMAIAAVVVAALAGLSVSADAAPSAKKKQRYSVTKERMQAPRAVRERTQEFGYDATPEHHPMGSRDWWRAMEREGRGGFGDNM